MTNTSTTKKTVSKAPIYQGVVVSVRMQKTIVVAVDTLKVHPKYGKRYRSTKKYKVHVPAGEYKEGMTVRFRECPPKSRDKRHEIIAE